MRSRKKTGAYPAMSLRKARVVFTRDYDGMIQSGRSIKVAGDTRPGTVADLFEGYVRSLRCAGKPSAKEVEKALSNIAATLGRTRPARDIEPHEIVDAIRPIYERGKKEIGRASCRERVCQYV